jgi:dihydroxyacetone kinase-like protein
MSAEFSSADLAESLQRVAAVLAEHRDELCRLDGVVGDGDHGLAMADGFAAGAKAAQAAAASGTLADVANAAAKALLNAVGASSGPLYATALMRAGKAAGARTAMPLDETRLLIVALCEGIVARGKAAEGERTMVDAWAPAARAAGEGVSFADIRAAAEAGAEATTQMIATKGRTSRLGERALGHIDPGAASGALVVGALTQHWESLR